MNKVLKILKRIIIALFVAGLAGGLFLVGINLYMKKKVNDNIITIEEAKELADVDCIMVLGASVRNGDTPSLMLGDRLDKGIEAYYAGCAPKLLMSGDHGGIYYDEVNVMKNYAKDMGVPSGDIFMDHAGFSTYESVYRAKEIFGVDKMIIVTQEYHLYRALFIADALGIEAYGIPAEAIEYNGQTMRDVREFLARGKDFVMSVIKPKASVMGTPIAIDGDGDITNDK